MWRFVEINNFFEEKDLNFLINQFSKIDLSKIKDNEINVFNNKIFSNGRVITSLIKRKELLNLHNKYTPKLLNLLQEIAPKKVKFHNLTDFHLVVQGKNYKHHIHEDDYRKLLSAVVYLDPEKNQELYFILIIKVVILKR